MPASMTALTVLAPPSTPEGEDFDEQASDQTPGNRFVARANATRLYVRNTTVSAIEVALFADVFGREVELATISIPGSGTENGVKVLGPFPASLLEHSTTEAASNGQVMVQQKTGSDGDLVFCPFD